MPAVKENAAGSGIPTERQQHRRVFKPIIEKRRRDRINCCLEELKKLVLEGMNKDTTRHSKLEKADILEMTVKYLKSVQMQHHALATSEFMHKYRAGYTECATSVGQYMGALSPAAAEGPEMSVRERLMQHLQGKMQANQPARQEAQQSNIKRERSSPPQQQQQQNAPEQRLSPQTSSAQEPMCYIPVGLKLVPTRLPSGDVAYVVPGSQFMSQQQLLESMKMAGQHDVTSLSPAGSPLLKEMWRPW
ncbi:PREDICTED: protein hairy-like [Priapulus caudatus]|uniref:Protein hairy-like n=1 Tax=Priapulus caudatus TaxID=37621 RepID=A0ABM1EKK6_PRICU|nr:PREDICTED: protein hairy-like [Priapulus caudatus]